MQNMSNAGGVAKNRFSVSIPQEINEEVAELKKAQYFDKPRSKMIRDLLIKGLEAVRQEAAGKKA